MARTVKIVGAGIAGLSAAIALRRSGIDVPVFERARQFAPVGAGIVLAPNAVQLLARLGVNVEPAGQPVGGMSIRDRRGRTLQRLDLVRLNQSFGPSLEFDRAELHEVLLRSLPAGLVQLGSPCSPALAAEADVVIGADGINSSVREQVAGQVPIRYSGCTCWRVICSNPGVNEAFEDWGGAARVGCVPLTRNRLYVYLVKSEKRGSPRQTSIAAIRQHFAHFAHPVPDVLEALASQDLLHHDLEELERPVWGRGKTILIGDAAHAMTPNQGQGASLAIEDAIVLPRVIERDDAAETLANHRQQRVASMQQGSRRLGELAHWQSPIAISLRNLLIRTMPRFIGDRHYTQMIEGGLKV